VQPEPLVFQRTIPTVEVLSPAPSDFFRYFRIVTNDAVQHPLRWWNRQEVSALASDELAFHSLPRFAPGSLLQGRPWHTNEEAKAPDVATPPPQPAEPAEPALSPQGATHIAEGRTLGVAVVRSLWCSFRDHRAGPRFLDERGECDDSGDDDHRPEAPSAEGRQHRTQ